jgi:hypothetical protein
MLLGSAGLTVRCLTRGMLKVGLSWPSLSAALGRETTATQWAVVYPAKPVDADKPEAKQATVGRAKAGKSAPGKIEPSLVKPSRSDAPHLTVAPPDSSSSSRPPAPPRAFSCTQGRLNADCDPNTLRGIVVLDGTWSQAKTLWWRNPWLLKCARVSLNSSEPSIYGKLRKQPKRHCLSTLEAVADALVGLGEAESVRLTLRRIFRTFVQRVRDASAR